MLSVKAERAGAFRPDVDGLRAVAIGLVVGYHAHAPMFGAGFIGVDVFFVISGFLITRLLLAEIQTTGKVDLSAFWARRVRRLLPAATLVIVTTGIGALLWAPLLSLARTAVDVAATALYGSNLLFAQRATDYFQSGSSPSLLLHTWSLSVEEQFYVFWPLLLAAIVALVHAPARRRRTLVVALAGVTLVSFVGSLMWTPSAAFFSSPARAWQFGTGACVAALAPLLARAPRLGWAATTSGLAALVTGAATLADGQTYPNLAALWPTLGTAAIIAGGGLAPGFAVSRLLGLAPLRWLGRRSYALYLWHWPVFLVLERAPIPDETGRRVVAVALALLLAMVTHHYVENPLRFSPRLTRSKRNTYVLAACLTLASLAVALILLVTARSAMRDPFLNTLDVASKDVGSIRITDCTAPDLAQLEQRCSFGAAGQPITVMLVGDSHAHQWVSALDELGRRQGWRGVYFGLGNCPAVPVKIATVPPCDRWHEELLPLLVHARPQLVVVGSAASYPNLGWIRGHDGRVLSAEQQLAEWQAGIETLVRSLQSHGLRFAWMQDVPRFSVNPASCLEQARDAEACVASLDETSAFNQAARRAELAAFRETGAAGLVDPIPWLCPDQRCPVMSNGIVMYSDTNHLTATFSRTLAAKLGEALAP